MPAVEEPARPPSGARRSFSSSARLRDRTAPGAGGAAILRRRGPRDRLSELDGAGERRRVRRPEVARAGRCRRSPATIAIGRRELAPGLAATMPRRGRFPRMVAIRRRRLARGVQASGSTVTSARAGPTTLRHRSASRDARVVARHRVSGDASDEEIGRPTRRSRPPSTASSRCRAGANETPSRTRRPAAPPCSPPLCHDTARSRSPAKKANRRSNEKGCQQADRRRRRPARPRSTWTGSGHGALLHHATARAARPTRRRAVRSRASTEPTRCRAARR